MDRWANDGGSRPGGTRGARRSGQVVQVVAFRWVQLKGGCQRVENGVRGAREVAPLKPDVVIHGNAGEHGNFFAAKPRHSAVSPVRGQPGRVGRDARPTRAQELRNFRAFCHASTLRTKRLDGRDVGADIVRFVGKGNSLVAATREVVDPVRGERRE